MPKEEIVEGLKVAIARGETLNKAMMSFYNSGYSKQDIEDAAKLLDTPQLPQTQIAQPQQPSLQVKQELQKSQTKTDKSNEVQFETHPVPQPSSQQSETQSQQQFPPLQQPQTVQKISNYGGKPSALGAVAIFVLVFFLLVLVGVLIAVFLFKEELAGFFNGFIG